MKARMVPKGRKGVLKLSHVALALAGAGLLTTGTALAQAAPGATASPGAPAEAKASTEVVIVTGVMAKTKAKDANVAFSVIDAKDIAKFTPMSADDILRDMPGVYVDSNEGVARNEVYTRGMSVGSGGPTAGYFWASILEDGLPVLPVKFSAFQDGGFYRNDISTDKVESVRGGSTGTAVTSSAGGVFNFRSAPVRNGASIQTRLGFEGDDYHLSWKQIDYYLGKLNTEGDAGFNLTGFARNSNGPANPGYHLNAGGQIKSKMFKDYHGFLGGSGTVSLALKHLDDNNAAMSNNLMPTYGYTPPQLVPGIGRNADLYMHGGVHEVPTDQYGNTKTNDPMKGYRYRQDALWLNWDHEAGKGWSYNTALKFQKSQVDADQAQIKNLYSLWTLNTFQDQFNVNQGLGAAATSNLNRMAGYYELYDRDTGQLRAKVYNNVGNSQGAINYRTGAACAAGTATSPAQCVTYSDLPFRTYDMRGGLVNGVQIPVTSSSFNATDVLAATKSELTHRQSNDWMLNLQANYTGKTVRLNLGVFAVKVHQTYLSWGSGFGLSPMQDGGITNLGVRFVTPSGAYQLTDEGGWGRLGTGFANFRTYNDERDISPFAGLAWKPTEKWDTNASFKRTFTHVHTYAETWVQNPESSGASSRTAGGLDNNPKTWYDNSYFVPPAQTFTTDRGLKLDSYSGSVGYNFTPASKVYYRYSNTSNNLNGAISRYTSAAGVRKPLTSQAALVQHEAAYVYQSRPVNATVTYFRTQSVFPDQKEGTNIDQTTYLSELYNNRYVTQGLETSLRWRVTADFEYAASATYTTGKTLSETTINFGSPGPQDDTYKEVAGPMPKVAKWMSSNTFSYRLGDFTFNLRHRFMSARKLVADPADLRYLPKQNNVDLSVQFLGIKDTRIALEIRNLTNTMYVSQFDTFLPTATGVTKSDIYAQLPNSASWIKVNASRSFWLTVKHDF